MTKKHRHINFKAQPSKSDNRALFFLPLFVAFMSYFPLSNTDMWWHLASAKEMLESLKYLTTDPFSYTETATDWINIHWLFQLGLYGVYSFLGLKGIIAIKVLLYALVNFVILKVYNVRKLSIGALLIIPTTIFMARYLMLARPIVLSLLFMALMIYIIRKATAIKIVEDSDANPYYLESILGLISIQIVWANIQGLFILGPIVVACYIISYFYSNPKYLSNFKKYRLLLSLPIILYFFCIINPSSWAIWLYPFKLFTRIDSANLNVFSENIAENYSLLKLFSTGQSGLAVALIFTIILGIVMMILQFKRSAFLDKKTSANLEGSELSIVEDSEAVLSKNLGHKKDINLMGDALLFIALAILAVLAKRNILIFFFFAGPIIANWINTLDFKQILIKSKKGKQKLKSDVFGDLKPLNIVFISIFILLCFVHLRDVMNFYPKNSDLAPFRHPIKATEFLSKNNIPNQRIFNGVRDGGYLAFNLYPKSKSFIDGRLILRSADFYSEYLDVLDNPEKFNNYAENHGINRVMLSTSAYDRYYKLSVWMAKNIALPYKIWKLEFWDGERIIFTRTTTKNISPMEVGLNCIKGEPNYSNCRNIVQPLSNEKMAEHLAALQWKKYEKTPYLQKESIFYMKNFLEAIGEIKVAKILENKYFNIKSK